MLLESEVKRGVDEEKDDEVDVDNFEAVQVPSPLPEPPQPSKEEVERHNLTHLNYRSWCPIASLAVGTIPATRRIHPLRGASRSSVPTTATFGISRTPKI